MSYTCVFTSTSIVPTNSDRKNGWVTSVSFTKTSGTLPSTGSVLKKITMEWSNVSIYATRSPYVDFSYGRFYFSNSSGAHSGSVSAASSNILNFTGGNIDFTVGGGGSSTSNVLNVRSNCVVTLTVIWEARTASTGTLTSTTGMQGGTIGLTIKPVDSAFTHKVVWSRDSSHSTTQNINAGVTTTTLTVPTSWPVGSATCKLTTYLNGAQVGSEQSYTWSVVVDPTQTYPTAGSLAVALQQSSYVPSSWNVYVQGYSKAKLTLSGYAAGTSASISKIELALGSLSQSGASATFTTGEIAQTGQITGSAKVTNSFGNSASTTAAAITVYPYESPKVVSIIAFRCLQNGTPNDFGTYIAITASAEFSSVNGKNSLASFQMQYRVKDTGSWSSGIAIQSGVQNIVSAGLRTDGTIYEVRVTAIDAIQNLSRTSTTKSAIVLTSECVLFFRDGGLNVSVGTQGTHENAIDINENWHIYHGDKQLDGVVPVDRGGTGQTTVAGARNALGLGNTAGALPIANGGTGATSVAGARNALGLGNTSGALPIANGGTGAANAADARSNLGITPANIGAAASSHNHSASNINSGTLNAARLPFKVQYGTVTLSGALWSTVSLSGFSSTPMVLVAYTDDAASSGLNVLKTRNRSTTRFDVCMAGSGSGSRAVCWLAIGT